MPGPRPLSPKAFFARHQDKLDARLLKVIADRKFEVECRACGESRICEHHNRRMTLVSCACKHTRPFYRVKRTLETHNEELKTLKPGYSCLKLLRVYVHQECGTKFNSSLDNLRGSKVPCPTCRRFALTDEEFSAQLRRLGSKLKLVGTYVNRNVETAFEYPCGHVHNHKPEAVRRAPKRRCPTCHPSTFRHFQIDGTQFYVKSKVEETFVRQAVRRNSVPSKDIVYEPKHCRVSYRDPVTRQVRVYNPDFEVNEKVVEVKNLGSLGLAPYAWGDQETVLQENRAKYKAAVKRFGDNYRLLVLVKGRFHRAGEFWKPSERKRLLNL